MLMIEPFEGEISPELHLKIQFVPVNIILLDYKNRSVNTVQGNDCCLFWGANKAYKYTAKAERKIFSY
jgi:hypothetical protein